MLVGSAGFLMAGSTSAFAATRVRPVVAELFTSQGCSSCPPADGIFSNLARQKEIISLTYHVDYWDYLGWRDTLGGAEYSQRQYDYAHSRGDMNVYTPQAIINGGKHVVGSKKSDVDTAVRAARNSASAAWVDFEMEHHGSDLTVKLPDFAGAGEATLWLLAVASSVEVKIERGENAGKTVSYDNVVRKMLPAGMWKGEAAKIMVPRSTTLPPDCDSCVALLQQGKVGPVIGAVRLNNLS